MASHSTGQTLPPATLRSTPRSTGPVAPVAVPYRGYWLYIAGDDVKSHAALAILEVFFASSKNPTARMRTTPNAARRRLDGTGYPRDHVEFCT